MNQPSIEAFLTWLALAILTTMQALHPGAACGAAFGCAFLLGYPDPSKRAIVRKWFLIIGSWGTGYSVGTAAVGSPGWEPFAMFFALATSALSAAVFGALNLMVRNDGPLPKWLGAVLDRVPFTKSRGSANDKP